ncbi:hypothetical protein ABZ502_30140 [Streptomyces abikoensis]|uniref:hypothetical protein n=1 Tax=Streptomyces abikoensis TaxID=97398 RepID=UPI0033F7DD9D
MRKRVSRPQRFAAIDNNAIDTMPSILAVGLLTCLVRARDGEDVTVESLAGSYAEGESSLTKAMRILVEGAFVVKFKIQRARSESVLEDGEEQVKRGGSWYTTFSVDTIPFTADDVAQMLDDILAGGNVKAVRVEPQRLDPRKNGSSSPKPVSRPTPQNAGVGPTCENTQPRPTPQFPGVGRPGAGGPVLGRPTPGQGGALYKEETVFKDSLPSAVPPVLSGTSKEPERESAAPKDNNPPAATDEVSAKDVTDAAQRKAATDFLTSLPGRLGVKTVRQLVPLVLSALTDGWTLGELRSYLIARCDVSRVYRPGGIYRSILEDLPAPQRAAVTNPCPHHPSREANDCLPCRSAAAEGAHRAEEEPQTQGTAGETVAALRERLNQEWMPGGGTPRPPRQRRKATAELNEERAAEVEAARNRYLAELATRAEQEQAASA